MYGVCASLALYNLGTIRQFEMTVQNYVNYKQLVRYVNHALAIIRWQWRSDPNRNNYADLRDYVTAMLRADGCCVYWSYKRGCTPRRKKFKDFVWKDVSFIKFYSVECVKRFKKKYGCKCKCIEFDRSLFTEAKDWLVENVGTPISIRYEVDTVGYGWEIEEKHEGQTDSVLVALIENQQKALEFGLRFA